jgi:acyl carrier protein
VTQIDDVLGAVKRFILDEFLPGEDPAQLTAVTPLMSSGILDSIATLKLIMFLEERFGVQLEAHEVDPDHLNTLEAICALVESKRAG